MSYFNIHQLDGITIVEFTRNALMDALDLQRIGEALYPLVEVQDRRQIVLDFEKVQYVSSQAIGIVLGLRSRLAALPNSALVVCGLNDRLKELMRITRLDRLLAIKPTQMEAVRHLRGS